MGIVAWNRIKWGLGLGGCAELRNTGMTSKIYGHSGGSIVSNLIQQKFCKMYIKGGDEN